jgi:hypothetical protein
MPTPNVELEEEELELEEDVELEKGTIFLLDDVILLDDVGITYNCERNVIARRLLN